MAPRRGTRDKPDRGVATTVGEAADAVYMADDDLAGDGSVLNSILGLYDTRSAADMPTEYVSTGLRLLDWIFSRGRGIPRGFYVHLYGPEGAGKSHLLYRILSGADAHGDDTLLFSTENSLVGTDGAAYLKAMGCSRTRLEIGQDLAVILNVIARVVAQQLRLSPDKRRGITIGVDSLVAPLHRFSSGDIDKVKGDAAVDVTSERMGLRAAAFASALPKIVGDMTEARVTLILLNQQRDVISSYGPVRGKTKKPTSGHALTYFAHANMEIYKGKPILRGSSTAAESRQDVSKAAIGFITHVCAEKIRGQAPGLSIELPLFYGYGYDDIYSLIHTAVIYRGKIVPVSGAYITWRGHNYTRSSLYRMLHESPEEARAFGDAVLAYFDSVRPEGNPMLDTDRRGRPDVAQAEVPEDSAPVSEEDAEGSEDEA